MKKAKLPTKVFTPSKFGEKLRSERRLKGYTNTKLFSKAIQDKAGIFIDFDTLMKYERGEREPDITKLLAISYTLYENKWLKGINELLMYSVPSDTIAGLSMKIDAAEELNEELKRTANRLSKVQELIDALSKELEDGSIKSKPWDPKLPEHFGNSSVKHSTEETLTDESLKAIHHDSPTQ